MKDNIKNDQVAISKTIEINRDVVTFMLFGDGECGLRINEHGEVLSMSAQQFFSLGEMMKAFATAKLTGASIQ
jgi:hypothetical protein